MNITKSILFKLSIIMLLYVTLNICSYSSDKTTSNVSTDITATLNEAWLLYKDRNYNDAFKKYKEILIQDRTYNTTAFQKAIQTLQRLGRQNQTDKFIDKVISIHKTNWRCYMTAALLYDNKLMHSGYILGNKFIRGYTRNYNTSINVATHDHLHALLLMHKAKSLIESSNATDSEKSDFFFKLSKIFIKDIYPETAIKLLIKSNIKEIPSYTQKITYSELKGKGAPVNKDGSPYFFSLPENETSAKNDGELFRYYLQKSSQFSKKTTREILTLAKFSQNLYGVETLSNFYYNNSNNLKYLTKLPTLANNKTIAKLESGIKEFNLPTPYNYLEAYINQSKVSSTAELLFLIAREFENRRQYNNAVKYLEKVLSLPTATKNQKEDALKQLQQITDSFVKFESSPTLPTSTPSSLWVRFRNTDKINIKIKKVNTERLINHIISSIKNKLTLSKLNPFTLNELGWMLADNKLHEFLGSVVYEKNIDLSNFQPQIKHSESRAEIHLPAEFTGGAYFVQATLENNYQANILLWFSDITISSKALSSGERLFFTSDSYTGKSIKNTELNIFGYIPEHWGEHKKNTIDYIETKLTTNKNGIALMPKKDINENFNYIISACTKNGCNSFIGFDQLFSYSDDDKRSHKKILYLTDKPLYKAGEEILISGWLRNYDYTKTNNISIKQPAKFKIDIYNPKGEKEKSKTVAVDKNGKFEFSFKTTEDSQLGIWNISSNLEIEQSGNYFRIEKYVKPEFTAEITLDNSKATLENNLTFNINAKYNFGKPVQNAKVEYKVYRKPKIDIFYPIQKWDWLYGSGYTHRLSKTISSLDYQIIPPYYTEPELIEEGTGFTDKDGTTNITFNPLAYSKIDINKSYIYDLKATIIDSSNRSIKKEKQITLSKAEFSLVISTDQNYYHNNEDIILTVTPFSNNNKLSRTTANPLKIKVYKYDTDLNKILINTISDITQNNEYSFKYKFNIKESGYYCIECETNDSQNNLITKTNNIYVCSKSTMLTLPIESNLVIIPKRKIYTVKDTAELLILSKEEQTTLLVFAGLDSTKYNMPDILQTKSNANIITYKIKERNAPNTFIEVLNTSNQNTYTATSELLIPPAKKIITLTVTPEKLNYAPGETAKITLKATDLLNKPISGNGIITIYDKALDELTGRNYYPDIYKYFWGFKNTFYPETLTSLNKYSYNMYNKLTIPMQPIGIFGSFFESPDTNIPAPIRSNNKRMLKASGVFEANIAVSEESMSDNLEIPSDDNSSETSQKVRKNFSTGAAFITNIIFDETGKATINAPLPDALTSWKIQAWIMTSSTEVGEANSQIITSKELMIIPSLPRYLIEGDNVNINAIIYNNSNSIQNINLNLTTDKNLLIKDKQKRSINVPANSSSINYWQLHANKESQPNIKITAKSNSSEDSILLPLPILEKGQKIYLSQTTLLSNQKEFNTTLTIPDNIKTNSSELNLTIYPHLSSLLIDVSHNIPKDRIKTNDTILASILPAIYIKSITPDISEVQPEFNDKTLNNKISKAIATLKNSQNNDGGWSWIGKSNISSPYITALILKSLEITDKAGYNIPASLITSARLYLINHQNSRISFIQEKNKTVKHSKKFASNLDALIYEVLSQSKNENKQMKELLYRDKNNLSLYSLSLFAIGLYNNNDNTILPKILKNIEQYLTFDTENNTAYLKLDSENFWWHWYNSESETISNYLLLRLITNQNKSINDQLAHYMINNIKHISRNNTIHNINSIFNTLKTYIQKNNTKNTLQKTNIALNNEEVATLSSSDTEINYLPQTITFNSQQLKTGANTLSVSTNSTTTSPLYFSYTASYFSLDDIIKRHGLELKTKRKYYKLIPHKYYYSLPNGKGGENISLNLSYDKKELNDGDVIKTGDLIEVELIIESKNDYEYIFIKDNKPACIEPIENKSKFTYNILNYYLEYNDKSVNYYFESMPRGTYSFTYKAYVLFDGSFTAPGAVSKGVFASDLNSNSQSFKFNVSK